MSTNEPKSELETETDHEVESTDNDADADADTDTNGDTDVSGDPTAIVAAGVLDDWLDTVAVIVDEAKLHVDPDGLQITAVDPANVAMVDTPLAVDAFDAYHFEGAGVLGMNISRFQDVIGLFDDDTLVHLRYDQETRKLVIEGEGMSFTLALIDPDTIRAEPEIPDLELPADVELEGRLLDQSVTAAEMVSDHVTFRADDDAETVVVEAEGDTDDVQHTLNAEDLEDATFATVGSLFSLDYVVDMLKPIGTDDVVRLRLGDDMPFKIHFEAADGEADVTYMLAPRIQSD